MILVSVIKTLAPLGNIFGGGKKDDDMEKPLIFIIVFVVLSIISAITYFFTF
jgi:hypothetical protein